MNDLNQAEKRAFLIKRLLDEDKRYRGMEVPADTYEQKRMLQNAIEGLRKQGMDDATIASILGLSEGDFNTFE